MIGISHRCCPAGQPLEPFLAGCREIGFDGVEHLWHPATGAPRPDRTFYAGGGLSPQAVRLVVGVAEGNLAAAADASPARAALAQALGLAGAARALGCRQVLLESGRVSFDGAERLTRKAAEDPSAIEQLLARRRALRDPFLENLCRNLHALLAAEREICFALVPQSDPLTLPGPEDLPLLLSELPELRLGYWHAPDVCAWLAARGLGQPESWIDAGRQRLAGCYLSDHRDGTLGQLPGLGHVDWKTLAGYLGSRDTKVLRVDPGPARQELVVTRRFLEGMGW